MITPDRRSWMDMIARLETESALDDVRYELYSGIVGQTAAASFLTFKKQNFAKLSGKEILQTYSKVRERVLEASGKDKDGNPLPNAEAVARFDLLNGAVEEILTLFADRKFTDKELDSFKEFLVDVPLELGLKIMKRLHEITGNPQRNKILNDKKFVELFKRVKLTKQEA
jgi:hypothetical protein